MNTGVKAGLRTALFAILLQPTAIGQPAHLDPPPVNEAALTEKLIAMVKPTRGERAIIVYDPTYYPGITTRLREALHSHGVQTYLLVEDPPAMINRYTGTPDHSRREQDAIATLLPVFRAADIFYWMPVRQYTDDTRWERLVEQSRVRSVHFHWLGFIPETAEAFAVASRDIERRALDVDLGEHARRQDRLAAALRGQTLRITTPAGTDLALTVARDQWFHQGNGDASKAILARARSIRDREIELPVGMFAFVPDPRTFDGTIVTPSIFQAGTRVKDATMRFRRGRAYEMTAEEGTDWFPERIKVVGPDGDKIAGIFLNTNPLTEVSGIGIDVGSNWEIGGRNRANGLRRMSMRLVDATMTAGGRTIVRDGRIQWDQIP